MQRIYSACYDRYCKSACVSLKCVLECQLEHHFNNNLEDSNAGTEAMDEQNVKLIYKVLLRSLRVVNFVRLNFKASTTSYFVCE